MIKSRATFNGQRTTQKTINRVPAKTRFGIFFLEFTPKGLYAVRFPGKNTLYTPGVYRVPHRVCTGAADRFSKYFKNSAARIKIRLDLSGCTLFRRKVYSTLRKVPAGSVVTYADLARKAGYPNAARAVGRAMRVNRLPIVIPCHRVVPSSGGLGNYSAGVKWKRWLLELEISVKGKAQRSK